MRHCAVLIIYGRSKFRAVVNAVLSCGCSNHCSHSCTYGSGHHCVGSRVGSAAWTWLTGWARRRRWRYLNHTHGARSLSHHIHRTWRVAMSYNGHRFMMTATVVAVVGTSAHLLAGPVVAIVALIALRVAGHCAEQHHGCNKAVNLVFHNRFVFVLQLWISLRSVPPIG